MRITHSTFRRPFHYRIWLAAAVSALLAGTLFAPSGAQAGPGPSTDLDNQLALEASAQIAQNLTAGLGDDRTAGLYQNGSGQIVVTVTDEAAAEAVRNAGGIPELVTYSAAELDAIHTELNGMPVIAGTSWGTDIADNQLVVTIDSSVSSDELAQIEAATAEHGDAVTIERISGVIEMTTSIVGGMGITEHNESGTYCTLGFNVQSNFGTKYGLTAGHCTRTISQWDRRANGIYISDTTGTTRYPGDDFGLVRHLSATTPYGTVWVNESQQQITNSRWPRAGEITQRVGTTSSDLRGKVIKTSETVNIYDASLGRTVTLHGMVRTSHCAKPGDSGGPMFVGTTALGLTSATNTGGASCSTSVSDYVTYFQPVQEALNYYGVKVY